MSPDLLPAVACASVAAWSLGRLFQAWTDRYQVEAVSEQLRVQRMKTATLEKKLESR